MFFISIGGIILIFIVVIEIVNSYGDNRFKNKGEFFDFMKNEAGLDGGYVIGEFELVFGGVFEYLIEKIIELVEGYFRFGVFIDD